MDRCDLPNGTDPFIGVGDRIPIHIVFVKSGGRPAHIGVGYDLASGRWVWNDRDLVIRRRRKTAICCQRRMYSKVESRDCRWRTLRVAHYWTDLIFNDDPAPLRR